MEASPLVSVITGYYNRKENLKESIQSVLDQTYPNIEYVVFDDCSTDGTFELIQSFDDPRLRVIKHTTNLGYTKGMIAAIAESKGEYIAIHGAGDVSLADRIARQVDYFREYPDTSIVGCLVEDVSQDETVIHSPISSNTNNHFTHGEVMFRKSSYYQTGGYNPIFKYGQFTNLKYELLKYGNAGFVDEVLYRRIHYKNGVSKNLSKNVEQKIYIQIGKELAQKGNIFRVDIQKITAKNCLNNISLISGTEQEKIFLQHLRERNILALMIYKLHKHNIISLRVFKRVCNKLLF